MRAFSLGTDRRHDFPRVLTLSALLLFAVTAGAQEMTIEQYEPVSTLVVPEHPLNRAKFPFIDVHSHHWGEKSRAEVEAIVKAMDAMNMRVLVNLSGRWGEEFRKNYDSLAGRYPDRFIVFANVDLERIDEPDFAEHAVRQLEEDVRYGARGLKIYKNLGMFLRDASGARVRTDDERLDPIWDACSRLGIPVLIHTGEPVAFWSPHDARNERWLELKQYPTRRRDDPERFVSYEQTMAEQFNLFSRHPKTTFISAHFAWMANDLERLGRILDEIPNMYVEMGAVLAELGRQPRQAREFLTKYQDRILFGKDAWAPDEYRVYFRTLETRDEYFDYYRKRHAHWKIYGIGLSDEVLRKIYYENAVKIIPGLELADFER